MVSRDKPKGGQRGLITVCPADLHTRSKANEAERIPCSEQQKPLSARPWQAAGGATGASQVRPPPPAAPAALPCAHAKGVFTLAEHVGVAAGGTTEQLSTLQSVSSLF